MVETPVATPLLMMGAGCEHWSGCRKSCHVKRIVRMMYVQLTARSAADVHAGVVRDCSVAAHPPQTV